MKSLPRMRRFERLTWSMLFGVSYYKKAGESALIVGHSNTVPEVIRALGGDVLPTIDDKEFDDLFVVIIYAKGKAKVTHLKYGNLQ